MKKNLMTKSGFKKLSPKKLESKSERHNELCDKLECALKNRSKIDLDECFDQLTSLSKISFYNDNFDKLKIEIFELDFINTINSNAILELIEHYLTIEIFFFPRSNLRVEQLLSFTTNFGVYIKLADLRDMNDSIDEKALIQIMESCKNLTDLLIESNSITSLRKALDKATSLKNLYLSQCNHLKQLGDLSHLISLETIYLKQCKGLHEIDFSDLNVKKIYIGNSLRAEHLEKMRTSNSENLSNGGRTFSRRHSQK